MGILLISENVKGRRDNWGGKQLKYMVCCQGMERVSRNIFAGFRTGRSIYTGVSLLKVQIYFQTIPMEEKREKMPDKKAFEAAKRKVIGIDRQRLGIGTLAEKSLHAILKNYYEPDEDHQEIPIENYVADIFVNGEIMEIQTRQFDRMRGKLAAFLPLYPVTIVYPIPYEKWLIWVDEESGTLSKKRKSPRKGSPYMAFPELYKIKMYLKDPNLRLRLVLLNMEEYKLLNGWSRDKKKGASRYDRIPTELVQEIALDCPRDFLQFVPFELEGAFTSREFAEAARIPLTLAQTVLNILYYVEAVDRVGKKGNFYLYEAKEY